MTDPRTNRDPGIDALKAVAILGVLVAHMDSREAFAGSLPGLRFMLGWCVTVFFGLSGYLEASKPATGESWLGYAKSKARRLLVPFVLLHLIYNLALVVLIQLGAVHDERLRQQGIAELILTGHSPQLYFLSWLWLAGVVLWQPLRAAPRLVAALLALLAGLSAILLRPENFGYGAYLENAPLYLAAFAIGFSSRAANARVAIAICAVAALIEVLRQGSYLSLHPAMAVLLLPALARLAGPVPWLARLGRYAFAIYLWHAPLLLPAVTGILRQVTLPPWAQLPAILLVTTSLCCAWGALLGRYPRLRRFAF